jgi:hypothetical protein
LPWVIAWAWVLAIFSASLVFGEQQPSSDVDTYSQVVNNLLAQTLYVSEGSSGSPVDMRKAEGDTGDIESRELRQPPDFSRLFPPTVPNGAFGCFKDQGDPQGTAGRDLSGFMSTDAAMTNAKCRASCAMKGFAFAGTQVGSYCFCGDSYGKSGPASCTARCSGNGGEVCGGVWANSISLTGAVPTIPSPPSNGGQCVIDIRAGQSYRHTEIQRWVVTGPGMQSAPGKLYPIQWTSTGSGFLHEDNGIGTKNDINWGISGSRTTQFRAQLVASTGNWLIQQAESAFTIPNGVSGTQQQTINNVAQQPSVIGAQDFEFNYPAIVAPGSLTQITEMKQFPVDQNHKIGYSQPASATGTVTCEWQFTP